MFIRQINSKIQFLVCLIQRHINLFPTFPPTIVTFSIVKRFTLSKDSIVTCRILWTVLLPNPGVDNGKGNRTREVNFKRSQLLTDVIIKGQLSLRLSHCLPRTQYSDQNATRCMRVCVCVNVLNNMFVCVHVCAEARGKSEVSSCSLDTIFFFF